MAAQAFAALGALWLTSILAFGSAAQERFDGHRVLRVTPRTHSEVQLLKKLHTSDYYHLDFWKQPSARNHHVEFRVSPDFTLAVTDLLNRSKIAYTVLTNDLQRIIDNEVPSRAKRSLPDILTTYNSHWEMNRWLDDTAARCGRRCSVVSIGRSHEGRVMRVIKVNGISANSSKPAIWIDAGIHGREWIAPVVAINIINKLVNDYLTDPCTRHLVNEFVWYILPVANPDGYDYSRTRNRMWRKNRKPAAAQNRPWWAPYYEQRNSWSCFGIDQNRNFDYHWGEVGTSSNPCSDTYGGPQAFSEPETVNIRDFIMQLGSSLEVYLTLHSYGQYWLYSWAYSRRLPADHSSLHAVAVAGANAIRRVSGRHSTYTVGAAARTLYAASGGSDDWAKGSAGVKYAYTIELPPGDDDSTVANGFVLPESEIPRVVRETWPGVQAMANAVLSASEDRAATSHCTQ